MAEYEHIVLAREFDGPRRRRAAPRTPPDRGPRSTFAPMLRSAVNGVVQARLQEAPRVPGVEPHLVVRLPLHQQANVEEVEAKLERRGVSVVATRPDKTVVAYNEEVGLEGLLDDVGRLERGPRFLTNRQEYAKSTAADYLFYVEPDGIKLWDRACRVGPGLGKEFGPQAGLLDPDVRYLVDVNLWFVGSDAQTRAVAEVDAALELEGESLGSITDRYDKASSTVLRVAACGLGVSRLLDLDAVAEVDLPPTAQFSTTDAVLASVDDLPTVVPPEEHGPSVCVLDTGITSNHPLLQAHLGDAQSFLSSTDVPADDHGHGTFVGGVAVFGDVRASFEHGAFESPVTLFCGKILNADGRFDDSQLVESQIESAVEYFAKAPHGCRVFNLSIGTDAPLMDGPDSRQSMLAEALDSIARRFDVLFIVSAGNHWLANSIPTCASEEDAYPQLLLKREAGLSDPATASLSLCVGALAQYDQPEYVGAARAVSSANEPSPFTRTGPGYGGAIKPDFVHYGGNLVTCWTTGGEQVMPNIATSVMSLSNKPLHELFAFKVGTSFAAPRVANLAARVLAGLRQYLGDEPDANLVRAVIASAACAPSECASLLDGDGSDLLRVVGYGLPDDRLALESSANRVTLVAQGQIPVDGFHVYPVPIPDAFRSARGPRRLEVCIAHDPLVNRHRREYLGCEMDFVLVRGKSLNEVIDSVRHADTGETAGDLPNAFQSPWRVNLQPCRRPHNSLCQRGAGTLQKAGITWQRSPNERYGDTYFLVVRCVRRWMLRGAHQNYGLAVVIESADDSLHAQVKSQVQLRQRTRLRTRGRQ